MSADPQDQGHYEGTPGAQKGKGAMAWEDFASELKNREADLAALLPRSVTPERFKTVAVAAVKQNPDLLFADRRSLFAAFTKAAQDGLLPDGREGVVTIYNTNLAKRDDPPNWVKMAQWNPMIGGIRKRARELDGIIIDAQPVYEKDIFVWHQGDDPRIEHEPAHLGTPRGGMIGAYAIFKREDGTILHREVMDKTQIEDTREQSKAKYSLMWTKFATEGYRKAVVRRGIKTVPVSEKLLEVVSRDDDTFEFARHEPTAALKPPPAPPPAPKLENKPAVTLDASVKKEPVPVEDTRTISEPAQEMGAEDAYADWLVDQYAELEACVSEPAVDDIRDRVAAELKVGDVASWREACAAKAATVFQ